MVVQIDTDQTPSVEGSETASREGVADKMVLGTPAIFDLRTSHLSS
jgi:hypothetical protein